MSARIKILAVIYIFVLAGIVILADLRETQYLFKPMRKLPYGDKIGHFLLMGILSFAVNLILNGKKIRLRRVSVLLGSLLVLIIVTLEEFSQILVRGRTFDAGDLVFDYAGIFIFGQAASLISRKTAKN